MEEKPKPEHSSGEMHPADISAKKSKSRVVDITDQFLEKCLILPGMIPTVWEKSLV